MQRLTAHDSETMVMIRSLLGKRPIHTELDDHFTIHAFYGPEHTPEYLCAVIDAVRGRYGDRIQQINDDAHIRSLVFSVEYDKINHHDCFGTLGVFTGENAAGNIYCHQLEEIHALQVRRVWLERLQDFVGGGQMVIDHNDDLATFTFQNNGVFVDVLEYDYIVKRKDATHFEIWPKKDFEAEWEPK